MICTPLLWKALWHKTSQRERKNKKRDKRRGKQKCRMQNAKCKIEEHLIRRLRRHLPQRGRLIKPLPIPFYLLLILANAHLRLPRRGCVICFGVSVFFFLCPFCLCRGYFFPYIWEGLWALVWGCMEVFVLWEMGLARWGHFLSSQTRSALFHGSHPLPLPRR